MEGYGDLARSGRDAFTVDGIVVNFALDCVQEFLFLVATLQLPKPEPCSDDRESHHHGGNEWMPRLDGGLHREI